MQQFTDVIMQFVNKMGYLRSKDIEGIIFYGSNQTGFGNQFSDIDLHIIFNNNLKEEIRGSDLIDGIRIEYFEKTLNSMYQKTINEFKNQGNAVVSMIVYGNIILDKNGRIKELQDYIKQIHSLPMPGLSEDAAKEQLAIINNFFDDLKNLIEKKDLYANHVYHLTLERIKDFYFSINNVSWSISTEFFFYLMFPFFVIWLHKFPKLKYILLLIIPIIIIAEPYFKTDLKLEKGIFYINPIVRSFDFILGILTCQLYRKVKDTNISFSKGTLIELGSLLLLGIFFYFHNDVARVFRYGIYYWIPMVAIVLVFAMQKGLFSKILQNKGLIYLGEISFAFYMIHMIVIKYGNQYLPKLNDFSKIGIYFIVALILSALIFEYFEKPVARWIKEKVK